MAVLNATIEVVETEYGARWFAGTTLRALRDVRAIDVDTAATFGVDEAEQVELLDAANILRIVAEIDGEPDEAGNCSDEVGFSIEVQEMLLGNPSGASWRSLPVPIAPDIVNADCENMLRRRNRERIAAERLQSARLQPLFASIAGPAVMAQIDRVAEEVVRLNAPPSDVETV